MLLPPLLMLQGAFYRQRCHHQRQLATEQGIEICLREVAFHGPCLEHGLFPELQGIGQADTFQ